MKKLVVVNGRMRPRELKQLLGSRLVDPSQAAALMLSKLGRNEGRRGFSPMPANSDDFVRVCVAPGDDVVRALRVLARQCGTLIREIKVLP